LRAERLRPAPRRRIERSAARHVGNDLHSCCKAQRAATSTRGAAQLNVFSRSAAHGPGCDSDPGRFNLFMEIIVKAPARYRPLADARIAVALVAACAAVALLSAFVSVALVGAPV
jgi:hypothetical protein